MNKQGSDLSIIIQISEDKSQLAGPFLNQIRSTADSLTIKYEILVVTNGKTKELFHEEHQDHHYTLIQSSSSKYGEKFLAGINASTGKYIITLEEGLSYPALFIEEMWSARDTADVIVASRYIVDGQANIPFFRKIFSKLLNLVFSRGLDLPIRDFSSGFRLYKRHIIKSLTPVSKDYDSLQEILVKLLMEGYTIREIPFIYQSKDPAYKRMIQFGLTYIGTFWRLWKSRNSIASADYDARAYNAMMPPQRYWQRQRYKHITTMLEGKGKCLDVGCGSSRIIGALPKGSIALDILIRKLRYARRFGHPTVQGSIFSLPVPNTAFPCVLCSQVIEHVPRANVLDELDRVLQPGGFLILGTPDYAKWQWNVIEYLYKMLLPQAYADEHITHYTHNELFEEFVKKRGYKLITTKYILQGELILELQKPTG